MKYWNMTAFAHMAGRDTLYENTGLSISRNMLARKISNIIIHVFFFFSFFSFFLCFLSRLLKLSLAICLSSKQWFSYKQFSREGTGTVLTSGGGWWGFGDKDWNTGTALDPSCMDVRHPHKGKIKTFFFVMDGNWNYCRTQK